MPFLCQDHHQYLQRQPSEDTQQLANDWLVQAIEHYQHHRWSYALPYVGCALEICWMQLDRQTPPSAELITRSLCLAVYCNNILQHIGDSRQGQLLLEANLQRLVSLMSREHRELINSCLTISEHQNAHYKLISEYTNWPFLAVSEASKGSYLH